MMELIRDKKPSDVEVRDGKSFLNKEIKEVRFGKRIAYKFKQIEEVNPQQVEGLIKLAKQKEEEMERKKIESEMDSIVKDAIKQIETEDLELSREDIHTIKDYLVDVKDRQNEFSKVLHGNLIEILKETHYIKKSQSANNKTTYSFIASAGVIFGMGDSVWMPYAAFVYEFFTSVLGKG